MNPTPQTRLLKPVTETIMHDGAPFVRLSPTKGMKNASVIYEAIKDMPARTLVRADFDKTATPLVYFPERPPKKVEIKSPIKARNIDADRKEMASFLASIVDAAYTAANPNTKLIKAALDLKLKINDVSEKGSDFTVGGIKNSLHTIAMAYRLQNIQKITSPHRLLTKQDSTIQRKRFKEFIQLDRKMFGRLSDALRPVSGSKYDTKPELAVYEMKQFLRTYRMMRLTENISFPEFLRKKSVGPNLYFFAERWREISQPTPTDRRIHLNTEPWAKELDKICPLIEKEFRRSARVVDGHQRSKHSQGWLVYPKSSQPSIPPLPPVPATMSPADQLGPMSPKQVAPNAAITAPAHLTLGGPSDRKLVVAERHPNPLDHRQGIDWFENASGDDLNYFYEEVPDSSQSDLLSAAFSPPGVFLRSSRLAPTEILPISLNLPYQPIELYRADSVTQADHTDQSDVIISATEEDNPSASEMSEAGDDSQIVSAPESRRPGPSQMMVYPKLGSSPLKGSIIEEVQ
ncbi:hypothetical protein MCEMAEM21_00736 [Oxalobacteraceae bacterium]